MNSSGTIHSRITLPASSEGGAHLSLHAQRISSDMATRFRCTTNRIPNAHLNTKVYHTAKSFWSHHPKALRSKQLLHVDLHDTISMQRCAGELIKHHKQLLGRMFWILFLAILLEVHHQLKNVFHHFIQVVSLQKPFTKTVPLVSTHIHLLALAAGGVLDGGDLDLEVLLAPFSCFSFCSASLFFSNLSSLSKLLYST